MPKKLDYNSLRDSERLLWDTIENCVSHYKKYGRSVKVIYLSKNMWQIWLGIFQRAYSEKQWEERKSQEWYFDKNYETEIQEGSPLQVDRLKWELWPLKTTEA